MVEKFSKRLEPFCVTEPNDKQTDRSSSPNSVESASDLRHLVGACVNGDPDAMRVIYEQCNAGVYNLMVRLVGRQDADDLTQQVFMKAFRKLNQFAGRSRLDTWLYRLATNEALQFLRQRNRRRAQPLADEQACSCDRPSLLKQEEAELLQAAIERVEPELRAVLTLKEQDGLSYQAIAEILQIPEGTVGSRLNRARRMLRAELHQLGWDG